MSADLRSKNTHLDHVRPLPSIDFFDGNQLFLDANYSSIERLLKRDTLIKGGKYNEHELMLRKGINCRSTLIFTYMVKHNKKLNQIYINQICAKPRKKNYAANTRKVKGIDETWSDGLINLIDCKPENIGGFRYSLLIIELHDLLMGNPPKDKNCS